MRFKSGLVILFLLVFSASVYAQDTTASAAETADNLRSHLLDVQGKEEALRTHLAELDEAIKPENIERSLAGVGSTRPEELRESRRRQLTIQRDGLRAQLQTLETERQRLEAALANAEALAYQQSARPTTQMMSARSPRQYQWLMLGGGALAALALGGGALFYRRKRRK
jgi:LPXTG-motif cell wall-anchored protein